MENMVLVITGKADGHVEPVVRHLDAAGVPWVRLNTEDAATNLSVTVDPASGVGRLIVHDSGRLIDLKKISAVWFRKPGPVEVTHFQLEPGALDYVEAEFREILDGLYALLPHAYWINNPFTTRLAHRKMRQLQVASNVGLRTPRTVVTNIPERVFEFAADLAGDVAIKSLGAISVMEDTSDDSALQYGIFTRRVSHAELSAVADKIRHLPTTFQEFVPKASELRITCVGDESFVCRIKARDDDATADDYRFDTQNLEHTEADCHGLCDRLRAYMREFGLEFACFDFIVPHHGEPVFLEANPNGQWLWVEHHTGLPIAAAIARRLAQAGGM
jgi:glutathione synthase/RimK-type ligase-like ATP-grasp enzyme